MAELPATTEPLRAPVIVDVGAAVLHADGCLRVNGDRSLTANQAARLGAELQAWAQRQRSQTIAAAARKGANARRV